MGNTNSKGGIPLKQCEQDLHWILNENVKWSERVTSAKLLLDEHAFREHVYGGSSGSGLIDNNMNTTGTGTYDTTTTTTNTVSTLDSQNQKLLHEIDVLLADGANSTSGQQSRPSFAQSIGLGGSDKSSSSSSGTGSSSATTATTGESIANSSSSSSSNTPTSKSKHGLGSSRNKDSNTNSGSGSNSNIFDMDKPINLPLSHPAHQYQASQTFGVAASKEIILMNTVNKTSQQPSNDLSAWTRHGLESMKTSQDIGGAGAGMFPSTLSQGYEAVHSNTSSPRSSVTDRFVAGTANTTATNSPRGSLRRTSFSDAAHDSSFPSTLVDTHESGEDEVTGAHTIVPAGLDSDIPNARTTTTSSNFLSQNLGSAGVSSLSSSSQSYTSQKSRIELATKYLFIHNLLQKMITSAQISYQVSLQLESLRKRLKPKRTKGLSSEEVNNLQNQSNEKFQILRDQRELFLKSRITLQWFYTDYNMNYAYQVLHDAELRTRMERDGLLGARDAQLASQSQQPYHHSFGSGQPSSHQQDRLSSLDKWLSSFENRRTNIELQLLANERYALSIAHHYLSRHSSGYGLQPSDLNGSLKNNGEVFPQDLYYYLDQDHTNNITRSDLHTGIMRLSEELDSLNARIRAIQMHNDVMTGSSSNLVLSDRATQQAPMMQKQSGQTSQVVQNNEAKLQQLTREMNDTYMKMSKIYSFFLLTFTKNIFVNLDAGELNSASTGTIASTDDAALAAARIDPSTLRADLRSITTSSTLPLNPLDIANEGVVGPDEIVAAENVGTGKMPEHQTSEIIPAIPEEEAQRQTGLVPTPRGFGDRSLLAKTSRPLPETPRTQAISQGKQEDVPVNAALAPKLHASELQEQHEQLQHVASDEVKESQYGGLHNANIPSLSLTQHGIDSSILREKSHQLTPIAEVVTPSPYGGQHDKNAIMELGTIDEGMVGMRPIVQEQKEALVMLSEDEKSSAATPDIAPHNSSLAKIVTPTLLAGSLRSLKHPTSTILVANDRTGSIHPSNALLGSSKPGAYEIRDQLHSLKHLRLEKAQRTRSGGYHAMTRQHIGFRPNELRERRQGLHHIALDKFPSTLSGGYNSRKRLPFQTIPMQVYTLEDYPSNLALARVVQPSTLAKGERLRKVKPAERVASSFGGYHSRRANLGGWMDSRVLRTQKDRLKAPSLINRLLMRSGPTQYGGYHTGYTPDTTHPIPESTQIGEIFGVPSNSALALNVQPSELKKEHRHLTHVKDVHESSAGGVHSDSANMQGYIDKLELQTKKEDLNSVHRKLDRAEPTLGGGIHTLGKPDTTVIPDRVLDTIGEVPANVVLAQNIRPADLKSQSRSLDHVPIEHQKETISGGVNMNDKQAALQPSFLDRVKELVGLPTSLDTTNDKLGRVVDSPRRRPVQQPIAASSSSVPVVVSSTLPATAAYQQQVRSVPYAQNSALAERVKTSDLIPAMHKLSPSSNTNSTLAKIITPVDLIPMKSRLHHVNIGRIEMRNDMNAGVGFVTTRKSAYAKRRPVVATPAISEIPSQPEPVYAQGAQDLYTLPAHQLPISAVPVSESGLTTAHQMPSRLTHVSELNNVELTREDAALLQPLMQPLLQPQQQQQTYQQTYPTQQLPHVSGRSTHAHEALVNQFDASKQKQFEPVLPQMYSTTSIDNAHAARDPLLNSQPGTWSKDEMPQSERLGLGVQPQRFEQDRTIPLARPVEQQMPRQ